MESWISISFEAALGIALTVFGFFIKKMFRQQEGHEKEQDEKIARVAEKLSEALAQMPFVYALRDESIRTSARLEQKIDKIYDKVSGVNGHAG